MFGLCGRDDAKHEHDVNEREIEGREDGSQYSLTGVLLPSLGATAQNNGSRRPKLGRHVISPYDHNYRFNFPTFIHNVFFINPPET